MYLPYRNIPTNLLTLCSLPPRQSLMHDEHHRSGCDDDDDDDGFTRRFKDLARKFARLPSNHSFQVAARTYTLSLSLSVAPAILPLLTSKGKISGKPARFARTLRNELGLRGFAFAMMVAIGGGTALDGLWQRLDSEKSDAASQDRFPSAKYIGWLRTLSRSSSFKLAPTYRTFLCSLATSLAAILLLQSRRGPTQSKRASIPFTVPVTRPTRSNEGRPSATLELTLMLLVRAFDAILQGEFVRRAEAQVDAQRTEGNNSTSHVHDIRVKAATMTDKLDALVFWAASSRYWDSLITKYSLAKMHLAS